MFEVLWEPFVTNFKKEIIKSSIAQTVCNNYNNTLSFLLYKNRGDTVLLYVLEIV